MEERSGTETNSPEPLDQDGKNGDKGFSRRKFTRGAMVASAVVFTLGNRPTWSHDSSANGCISPNTLYSWDMGNNLSYDPNVNYGNYVPHSEVNYPDHAEDHEAFPHDYCPPL